MAKVRNNIVIRGLSGMLGDQVVVKIDKAGRTILAAAPGDDPNRNSSPAQRQQQERFREASVYAMSAKDNEVYVEKAKGTPKIPQNVAMADWFHAPEVSEVDVADWHGAIGQPIRIKAVDDVKVTQVNVVITDAAGVVMEQGPATQADGNWWTYTTTATAADGARIVASARDLPGNIAEFRWEE